MERPFPRRGCGATPSEYDMGDTQWLTPNSGKLRRFVTWTTRRHRQAPKTLFGRGEHEQAYVHKLGFDNVDENMVAQWYKRNYVKRKPVAGPKLKGECQCQYGAMELESSRQGSSPTDYHVVIAPDQWPPVDRQVVSPTFSDSTGVTLVNDGSIPPSPTVVKQMSISDLLDLATTSARQTRLSTTTHNRHYEQHDIAIGMQTLELSADSLIDDSFDHNAKYIVVGVKDSELDPESFPRHTNSLAAPTADKDQMNDSSNNSTTSENNIASSCSSDGSFFDEVDAMQSDILNDADPLLVQLVRARLHEIKIWEPSGAFMTCASGDKPSETNRLSSRSSDTPHTGDRHSGSDYRCKKRKSTHNDEDDENNDGNEENNNQYDPRTPCSPRGISRKLACPFHKFNPVKYRTGSENRKKYKTCTRGFTSPKDLLDHLKGVHSGPKFVCERCSEVFKSSAELSQHVKQAVSCQLYENPEFAHEGYIMTPERKLALKRKSPKLSVEQHWYHVWSVLFPGSRQPTSIFQDMFGPEAAYDRIVEELVPGFVQQRLQAFSWCNEEEEDDYLRRFVQAVRERLWEIVDDETLSSDRNSSSHQSAVATNDCSVDIDQEEFGLVQEKLDATKIMPVSQNLDPRINSNECPPDNHLVMLDQGPTNHGLVSSTLLPLQQPTVASSFRDSGLGDPSDITLPIHLFGSRNTEQGVDPKELSLNRTDWHSFSFTKTDGGRF